MVIKAIYNYAHAMTVLQEWLKDNIQGNNEHAYATIHYDSMELLLDNGLLKENQLKDFIKYFNIIQ